jgi:hypothetical protein
VATFRERLRGNAFALWIEPIRPVETSADRLVLAVPSHSFAWVQRRYGELFAEAVREVSELEGVVLRKAGA